MIKKIEPGRWVSHFKRLVHNVNMNLTDKQKNIERNLLNHKNLKTFTELDFKITPKEILKAISTLKNRKSAGTDGILNEMIKATRDEILPSLIKLFNLIYSTGIFSEKWAESMIKPLFKGGNPFDPSDYKGISLTSCLGKLFCSILNTRLVNFLETNKIYTPHHIAFRRNFRTSDHIFVLQTLINKYTSPKFRDPKVTKNLYVCFVDLKKAFDTIWRGGTIPQNVGKRYRGEIILNYSGYILQQ